MKWVIGVGTLIGSSFLMFAFASGLGGFARMTQAGITGPVSGIMGGTIAAAGGIATAAIPGVAAAGGMAIRGLGTTGLGGGVETVGRGALASMRAGAQAGPVGGLVAGPLAGRGAAEEVRAKYLREEMGGLEGTPPRLSFLNSFGSPKFSEDLARLGDAGHANQEIRPGETIIEEMGGGRLNHTDMPFKMLSVVSGRKVGDLKRVMRAEDATKAFNAAVAEMKGDPNLARKMSPGLIRTLEKRNIPTDSNSLAALWARHVYQRARGERGFAPHGKGVPFAETMAEAFE
jgi:hypothetical protein